MASPHQSPSTEPLAITGLGMVSALGIDVVACCAAARAGLSRARDLADGLGGNPETGEAESTLGHEIGAFTRGFVGVGRLIRLGVAALQDLLRSVTPAPGPRLGIVLNVGSGFHFARQFHGASDDAPLDPEFEARVAAELDSRRSSVAEHLVPRLLAATGLRVDPTARRTVFSDETGLVEALRTASGWLTAGAVDACIVGGIDSQLDPESLAAMHALGIVKTASNPVGRMPGEAAAMLLVEAANKASSRARLGVVGGLATEAEPKNRFESGAHTGEALAKAASTTLATLPPAATPCDLVIADLTGEEYRAVDWGHAQLRLRKDTRLAAGDAWYPALSFGAIGAAAGPVALCMACRGFARGYGPSRSALVWLLADGGERATLWVRQPDR